MILKTQISMLMCVLIKVIAGPDLRVPGLDLSPIENIWRIIKRKIRQRRPQTLQARMGPNSNTKTPETHNIDAQMSSNCFEMKRKCYTMINIPPSQLF